MRDKWCRLGLLLVVPWMSGCMSGHQVRLDTDHESRLAHIASDDDPPPVEVRQQEFVSALTDLVLHLPLPLRSPSREGRIVRSSWLTGAEDKAREVLERQCAPEQAPEECWGLPSNAPPPETLARLRLALSFAMDTVWEGAAVPLGEYMDPLAFKVMVYTALCTYLVLLMVPVPEPVTKGIAAVLTLYLVAYLGSGPMREMVKAAERLMEESTRATTSGDLRGAGQRFGRVLGENGMRVLLLLATAALGGRGGLASKGPRLPGFSRAALLSPMRTGVSLEAAGRVSGVVLGARGLVVGLAPTAVAANSMGPHGGSSLPKKGRLTGESTQPRPSDDKETTRALTRENESAKTLAENGYDVEQNPSRRMNGRRPDYQIDGEYADCYAPSTSNPRNIRDNIALKVNTSQADRIVLNLDDSQVAFDALRQHLAQAPIADLKIIIAVKDGRVFLLYP